MEIGRDRRFVAGDGVRIRVKVERDRRFCC